MKSCQSAEVHTTVVLEACHRVSTRVGWVLVAKQIKCRLADLAMPFAYAIKLTVFLKFMEVLM